jgi:hypothetical protein
LDDCSAANVAAPQKLRRERLIVSRRSRYWFCGPQVHRMRTLSNCKKAVSVNVPSSKAPVSALEAGALASAQAVEQRVGLDATD